MVWSMFTLQPLGNSILLKKSSKTFEEVTGFQKLSKFQIRFTNSCSSQPNAIVIDFCRCWDSDAMSRPSFKHLVKKLEGSMDRDSESSSEHSSSDDDIPPSKKPNAKKTPESNPSGLYALSPRTEGVGKEYETAPSKLQRYFKQRIPNSWQS